MDADRIARGRKIKEFRQKKKLTLQQLSELSGISVGFLSKIESGVGNPTANTIQKISYALKITTNELMAPTAEGRTGETAIPAESFRLGMEDRQLIYSVTNSFRLESLFEENPHFKINVMTFDGGFKEKMTSVHSYDKLGIVAKGTLCIDLEGGNHYELTEGECIMIRAQTKHTSSNQSLAPCVSYWVEIVPEEQSAGAC